MNKLAVAGLVAVAILYHFVSTSMISLFVVKLVTRRY